MAIISTRYFKRSNTIFISHFLLFFQDTVPTAAVEIDCTEPEIKVSPRRTVEIDISDAQPNSGTGGDSTCSRQRRKRSSKMKSVEEENSASTSNPSRGKNTKQTADLTKIHFLSIIY